MKPFAPRRLRAAAAAALACAAPVIAACNSYSLVPPDPEPIAQSDKYRVVNAKRELDILFMVDNSLSMAQEQKSLVRNFPEFVRELEKIEGGLPDVRIAVVSSDVGAGGLVDPNGCNGAGDGGNFQFTRVDTPVGATRSTKTDVNCGLTDGAPFIAASAGGTITNLAPGKPLEDVFSCMALRGIGSCGFEHQLQSVRLALYPQAVNPGNRGFLRDGAHLAIVIITDEDDCSAPPDATDFFTSRKDGIAGNLRCAAEGHVCGGKALPESGELSVPLTSCVAKEDGRLLRIAELVEDIKALKPGNEDKIIVSAIAGWPLMGQEGTYRVGLNGDKDQDLLSVCRSSQDNGTAMPAVRINAFVKAFGKNGRMYSICQDDLREVLRDIGEHVRSIVGTSCVDAPIADTDPRAGLQPECIVGERRKGATAVEKVFPACGDGATKPCWRLEPKATCGSGFEYVIDRGGAMAAKDTEEVVKCRSCAREDDPACKNP